MRALIIDCETTGLTPGTDHLIEIAAVLYSIEHRCVLASVASLVDAGVPNPIEDVNRIPSGALRDGFVPAQIPIAVRHFISSADIICAHRAEFDRGFVAAADPDLAASRSWSCTKFDVEWPGVKNGASLVETALHFGVPVWQNHRALTDCMLLAHVFERVQALGHDLELMLQRSLRPKVTVSAHVPFERNDELKAAGFRWHPKPIGQWRRTMFVDDVPALPFPTREVAA